MSMLPCTYLTHDRKFYVSPFHWGALRVQQFATCVIAFGIDSDRKDIEFLFNALHSLCKAALGKNKGSWSSSLRMYCLPWKMCCKCGTLGRFDNLKGKHFPKCQPNLEKWESGYLLDGQLPERNHEDFRMMLKLMGVSEKARKPAQRSPRQHDP